MIVVAAAALVAVTIIDLGVWPVIACTFVVMSTLSFVMPNSTALALAEHGAVAGTASALLGVTQFLIGGLAAPLVGIGGTGSAVPMAVVMLSLASGAVAGEPMALIAISAPYGAGGSQVAPALAERLGVPFLDRPADTEPDHGLLSKLSSIGLAWGTPAGMELEDLVPGETRRREIEAELAALEHGVVLGRAAALLKRDDPTRAARAAHRPARAPDRAGDADGGHRPPAPPRRACERTDRARLAYHQTLYCVDPRKPELYHLMVDSTALPFETCVELIARVSQHR